MTRSRLYRAVPVSTSAGFPALVVSWRVGAHAIALAIKIAR
jgi:hypothetical protein